MEENLTYPFLEKINSPADLKKMPKKNLSKICYELRQFIIDEVSENPGHLGANLGVVELTIALHYVLNTPYDNLIWDVGHQAYGHKILTGRRELFKTNRLYKGISGFPKKSESQYDTFGTGHASTSISAALGMAIAAQKNKEEDKLTVAVIGDGAMTGGLAFEGLNNVAINQTNLLIVLNDNNIAIDPNIGGISNYLVDITASKPYNKLKKEVWAFLGKLNYINPNTRSIFQNIENSIKSLLLKQGNLFEALNIRYFGPIDGHNVKQMVNVLNDLKKLPGPKILHCLTKKGKGIKEAEKNQTLWHAPGKFCKKTEKIFVSHNKSKHPFKYQEVFGHTILELAKKNDKILGITPAMPTGSSLNIMMEQIPERTFDVGIAEAHAVTFSAGLATQGYIPFCNIYSSFLQRAYDQVIHDVALQKLHIILCLDRAGLVGSDGATHHGAFDLAFLRCIPDMIISAPLNEIELRNLMFTSQLENYKKPFIIRYPRGEGRMAKWKKPFKKIFIGKGQQLSDGEDVAILSIGTIGNLAIDACQDLNKKGISVAHYDMRFLKPIDRNILHNVFQKFNKIITLEDGTIHGGLGTEVLEFMNENSYNARIYRLGIPDRFINHGTQQELYKECNYNVDSIIATCEKICTKVWI